MDQMMLGQVLSKLNILEELILLLFQQVQNAQQAEAGIDDKLNQILQATTNLQTSVNGIENQLTLIGQQSDQINNNVNSILIQVPNMKCRYPGGKPETAKTTKKSKGE